MCRILLEGLGEESQVCETFTLARKRMREVDRTEEQMERLTDLGFERKEAEEEILRAHKYLREVSEAYSIPVSPAKTPSTRRVDKRPQKLPTIHTIRIPAQPKTQSSTVQRTSSPTRTVQQRTHRTVQFQPSQDPPPRSTNEKPKKLKKRDWVKGQVKRMTKKLKKAKNAMKAK